MSVDRVLRRDDGTMIVIQPDGLLLRRVTLGVEHMAVLVYDDGTYRFQHLCDRGDRGILVACPALQCGPNGTGHQIAATDPLTVTPSVLCPDCGTHGYVTAGAWASC